MDLIPDDLDQVVGAEEAGAAGHVQVGEVMAVDSDSAHHSLGDF